jgi:hypothetical protein
MGVENNDGPNRESQEVGAEQRESAEGESSVGELVNRVRSQADDILEDFNEGTEAVEERFSGRGTKEAGVELSKELSGIEAEANAARGELEESIKAVGDEKAYDSDFSSVDFFKGQDGFEELGEKERIQVINHLSESVLDLSNLKENGINTKSVENKLRNILKEQEMDVDIQERIFEMYSKVSSPAEALRVAKEIEAEVSAEKIEELKRAAIILEAPKVVGKRFDFDTKEVVIDAFGGDYTLSDEQKDLLAEMAPYFFGKETEVYDFATQETEPQPPLEGVELSYQSYLDSLEITRNLPFNSSNVLENELKKRKLLEAGDISHFKGLYSRSRRLDIPANKTNEIVDEWMGWKQKQYAMRRRSEYPYGDDVPDLKQEHLPALYEEMSKEIPEDELDTLQFYTSVANQVLERMDDLDGWSANEKKWLKYDATKPFMEYILNKESVAYSEVFKEKIEPKVIEGLSKMLSKNGVDLDERVSGYEIEVTNASTELFWDRSNRGSYNHNSHTIKIKRGLTGSSIPTHELIHALSHGKSEKPVFMDDEGRQTSLARGLTEATVDALTKRLTGKYNYRKEVQALNQLRFWTFSSPDLRQNVRPKAMEDKDLSLNFFIEALFDESKSLGLALENEGFDDDDKKLFMDTARELFASHAIKSEYDVR